MTLPDLVLVLPRPRRRRAALALAAAALGALGAVGALGAAWRGLAAAFAVPPDPPPPVTYHLVPLAGSSLQEASYVAAGLEGDFDPAAVSCLEALDPLVAHPHWQLRVATVSFGCTGSTVSRAMTIDADGGVTWRAPGVPTRRLVLTDGELARIRGLDRLSCVLPADVRPGSDFIVAYGADAGPIRLGSTDFDAPDGARVATDSPMGAELAAILDAAITRYDRARLAWLGAVRLELAAVPPDTYPWSRRAARYRVRLGPDRVLVVSRGRRVVARTTLEPWDVVDLADWALHLPRAGVAPGPEDLARGRILVDGRAVPIAFGEYPAVPALEPIRRALDDAQSDDAAGAR